VLILRKIIKIVAARCQILRLKCIKFDFGRGSSPHPAGGALQHYALPDPLAATPGWREGRRGGEEGREGRGKECLPHLFNPTLTTGFRCQPTRKRESDSPWAQVPHCRSACPPTNRSRHIVG